MLFFPMLIVVSLFAAPPTTAVAISSYAPERVREKEHEDTVFRKAIDENRELIARQREFTVDVLPEVKRPLGPIPEGHRVVVPSRLTQVDISLRTRQGDEMILYTRLVQEYEPYGTGYSVLDVRLENAVHLIVLARDPSSAISLTVASPTTGHVQVATLFPSEAGFLHAAGPPIELDQLDVRLIGSLADETLGVSVRSLREDAPAPPKEFRLDEAGEKLRLVEPATRVSSEPEE